MLTYLVCGVSGCLPVTEASSRVTTCLENLEMSGILTVVRDISGILLGVREKILSGKSGQNLFIAGCVFASVWVFSSIGLVLA